MTQIISGTGSDLTVTVASLVKDLLEANWPVSGYDPIKSDIGFGLERWDDYGDIDIHVVPDRVFSQPITLGWKYSQVTEYVYINVYVRKNQQTIPTSLGGAQRMVESIIKDNAKNLGQGINELRFDGWSPLNAGNRIQDVWLLTGKASAIFFRVGS